MSSLSLPSPVYIMCQQRVIKEGKGLSSLLLPPEVMIQDATPFCSSSLLPQEPCESKPDGQERWNKGRGWDGIGPWCDPLTAEELAQDFYQLSTIPDATIMTLFEYVAPRVAEKRALTYLDGDGGEIENQSFGEVCVGVR